MAYIRYMYAGDGAVDGEEDDGGFDSVSLSWFNKIISAHAQASARNDTDGEPRHYHTMVHLEEMFGYLDWSLSAVLPSTFDDDEDSDQLRFSASALCTMATFFHDAVYNPRSGTNEEDSTVLYERFASELDDLFTLQRRDKIGDRNWPTRERPQSFHVSVVRFILCTKSHTVAKVHMSETERHALECFLDADMSVLGKYREAYSTYAAAIRSEYGHVPHEIYCRERGLILRKFLKGIKEGISPLYITMCMREELENRAVENLCWEIRMLEKGIIPGKGGTTTVVGENFN